jgi:hypothetical protein
MPSLRRCIDGKGDSGSCSQAIKWNDNDSFKEVVSNKPVVGCYMLVGSVTARSYSNQDYWLTTEVTEIIEETETYVKFKTKNSIYEWFNNK